MPVELLAADQRKIALAELLAADLAKDVVARMAKARQSAAGGDRKSADAVPLVQNSAQAKTRDIVAESAGLSHDTLRKIEKIEAQAPAEVRARLATMRRGSNQHASIEATSQTQAAELLNVSTRSVAAAAKVRDEGAPELVRG